jgi:lipoprotein
MKYKRGNMGRNLKKILSFILLVSMLSVVGCNKDERNESKRNEGVSVEDAKKEKKKDKFELSLGEINDDVYLSKMLNLKFNAKSHDMDIYYEEGLIGENDDAVYDRTDMDEVKEKIADGAVISDMGASDMDGLRSVSITIRKAPDSKTLNNYIFDQIREYEDMFKEDEEEFDMMEKSYVNLTDGKVAGKKIPGIEIKSVWEHDGVRDTMFYEKQLFLKYEDYIVTIDVSAYDSDDAQSLLDIFEKPNESDFEKAKNTPKEDETRKNKPERRDKRKRQEENRKESSEETKEESSTAESSVEESREDKVSTGDFCAGVIDGNVYTNSALNIKIDITGKHMVFASDYEMELLGRPSGIVSEEDKKYYVDKGKPVLDMVAHDVTFDNTVLVLLDGDVDLSKVDVGEDSYFDKGENAYVERKKEKINFNGKELLCLSKVETKDNGSKYYEKYLIIPYGKYTATIGTMGSDEEFVKNAFKMFTIAE